MDEEGLSSESEGPLPGVGGPAGEVTLSTQVRTRVRVPGTFTQHPRERTGPPLSSTVSDPEGVDAHPQTLPH